MFLLSDEIILNGSLSSDPDSNPGEDQGLVYRWYCKQMPVEGEPTEKIGRGTLYFEFYGDW